MYNDEKPDGSTSSYRGHTKGVSAFDANGGFFLDHSVPRFPPAAEDTYEFPDNEATYGQSFMCVSVDAVALETIFGQWLFTYPNDYSSNFPAALQAIYPSLVQVRGAARNVKLQALEEGHHRHTPRSIGSLCCSLCSQCFRVWGTEKKCIITLRACAWQVAAGKHVTSEPWTSVQTFATVAGLSVRYVAKYSTWGQDFWEDLVAPSLGVGLYTETWQNGAGRLASFCTSEGYSYDVENVLTVNLGSGAAFKETQDHSKWGVSIAAGAAGHQHKAEANNATAQWACVGDLNMQSGQESRAGGALCVQNTYLYGAYASLITSVETC
jgi:deoxyribonuclease-2